MNTPAETTADTALKIASLERELQQLKQTVLHQRPKVENVPFPLLTLTMEIGEYHFALPLETVEEVAYMVLVTPLPGAPPSIRGTIKYRGHHVPVIDLESSLTNGNGPLTTDLRLVIVSSADRLFALPVHHVHGVVEFTAENSETLPGVSVMPAFVECLLKGPDGPVTLLHPGRLLAAGECDLLDQALSSVIGAS